MTDSNPAFQEQIDKADVLVEALPYIQSFRGETVLIKLGGSVMEDPQLLDALLRDVVLMEAVGIKPVVVHGGGKAISAAFAKAGIEPEFVSGLRVTSSEAVGIVEQTLAKEVNPNLVRLLEAHGARAAGVFGKDVFLADRMQGKDDDGKPVDIGFVGHVTACKTQMVEALLAYESVPVVSPLAAENGSGATLNVNADLAASALAASMKVAKLVYISDVLGVMRDPADPTTLIPSIAAPEVEGLADEGVIKGGMLPKLRSAVDALGAGVGKVHLVDGRVSHSLLLEIFTKVGIGTQITA